MDILNEIKNGESKVLEFKEKLAGMGGCSCIRHRGRHPDPDIHL